MDRLRILVLTSMYPVPWNPAHGVFVRDHVAAVARAGVEPVVLRTVAWLPPVMSGRRTREHASSAQLTGGVPVHHAVMLRPPWQRFHSLLGPLTLFAVSRHAARIRQQFPFEIMECHEVTPTGFAGVRLAQQYGVPSVCVSHGSDLNVAPYVSEACRRQTEFVIRRATQVVAVGQAQARRACEIADPLRPVEVIYNGVDVEHFRPLPDRQGIRARLGIPAGAQVVAFVGNLLPAKGVRELLQAAAMLVRDFPALMVLLVGPDSIPGGAARLAKEVGVGSNVAIVGAQPHDRIPLWLGAADIFALPSYTEGLPVSILEAMACELPVVASAVGGVPEVVSDSHNGLLLEPRNPEMLRDALSRLLSDEEMRIQMGKAGRQVILDKGLTWGAHAQRYAALYDRLLSSSTGGGN